MGRTTTASTTTDAGLRFQVTAWLSEPSSGYVPTGPCWRSRWWTHAGPFRSGRVWSAGSRNRCVERR